MSALRWPDDGRDGRSFVLHGPFGDVPGVLWTPGGAGPWPIVLGGHGFTLHKRAPFPLDLPARLTAGGMALAIIDAPGHGDRQPDGGRDRAASDAAWRAHWREHGGVQIAAEYRALLDALTELPDIDASRCGYWGLSLATQYGVAVLAGEPRIRAAVIGLSALPDPGPRIAAYAAGVRCPVLFVQQQDDEIAPRAGSHALFAAIGSEEKTLRRSPGSHVQVPEAVWGEAERWLGERLA